MKFLSVCSGIEAASCAWHPLGWRAHALAEIEPFPCAVLAHHYPGVPNWGDMTKFREWPDAVIDVLAGGTPCQSFSVAGLRKGLADPRGNLALVYLGILDRYRPRWMVWENVPGVLSSNGGRDFGAFLGGLAELGYGFAYRVLDAQFFGLAQRRKRVFVVGHSGDWRRAAAVLFERESLSGNPAPRREAGKGAAPTLSARTRSGGGLGTDFDCDGGLIAYGGNNTSGPIDVATAQTAHGGTGRLDFESETFVMQAGAVRENPASGPDGMGVQTGIAYTLEARAEVQMVAHAAPICFDETQVTSAQNRSNPQPGGPAHALAKGARPPAIAFRTTGNDGVYETGDVSPCLTTATDPNQITLLQNWRVRRLVVSECEKLQGFKPGYTAITYRGKPAADGHRYKALGNSMAVPVMRWIGERIDAVDHWATEAPNGDRP